MKKKIVNMLKKIEKCLIRQLPKWKEGEAMPIWIRLENFDDERDDSVENDKIKVTKKGKIKTTKIGYFFDCQKIV